DRGAGQRPTLHARLAVLRPETGPETFRGGGNKRFREFWAAISARERECQVTGRSPINLSRNGEAGAGSVTGKKPSQEGRKTPNAESSRPRRFLVTNVADLLAGVAKAPREEPSS